MNTEKASRRGSRDDRQRTTRIGDSRGQPLRSARNADRGAVHQARYVRGKAAAGLVFLAAGAASRPGTSRFRHPDEKTIWLVLFHCYEVTQMRARGSRCVTPGTSYSLRRRGYSPISVHNGSNKGFGEGDAEPAPPLKEVYLL